MLNINASFLLHIFRVCLNILSHLSKNFRMPDAKKRCWLLSKTLTKDWLHVGIWCKFVPI